MLRMTTNTWLILRYSQDKAARSDATRRRATTWGRPYYYRIMDCQMRRMVGNRYGQAGPARDRTNISVAVEIYPVAGAPGSLAGRYMQKAGKLSLTQRL